MTVEQALGVLRAEYPALLEDLARGDRVFWIGAGVSRDQVPGVEPLLQRVLVYLRDNVVPGDPDDVHLVALERILEEHLPGELDEFRKDPASWDVPTDLSSLVTSYSKILSTEVGDEAQDYLLWEAVDVRETYGSALIEPGPEHRLIAYLVHEGLLCEAVTTNWDGLIERAVRESSIDMEPEKVSVLMSMESFRSGRAPFKLYKPHGCAVLARADPSNREFLVAQTFDINTWRDNPIFTSMFEKLKDLAKNRESLMLGTSVQDSNLLGGIASATQDLRWPWDPADPACLFAEPEVARTQIDVLQLVYRDDYPPNRREICARSATGMYSGLLLAAGVLHTVLEKFKIGIAYALQYAVSSAVVTDLEEGVAQIEALIAREARDSTERTVELIRDGVASLVQRFFEPAVDLVGEQYKAVYEESVRAGVPGRFRHLGIPELSVALGLLGLGMARNHWTLELGTGAHVERGVLVLTPTLRGGRRPFKVLITRDWIQTNALKSTDLWISDPSALLVIQVAGERPSAVTRGPGGGLGSRRRAGAHGPRVTLLSALESKAGDPDLLMDAFRAEVSA